MALSYEFLERHKAKAVMSMDPGAVTGQILLTPHGCLTGKLNFRS